MSKKLCEMTLEELWQLFPIMLTEHDPCWADWYAEEVVTLKSILPPDTDYHHIGSTAVSGIMAKPIIDILIVVNSPERMKRAASLLQSNGCIVMSTAENRISLNKGYTENGFADKVFHLHIRLENDVDEIYFRDYLIAHPDVAKDYEQLKLRLWKQYEHDRDGYTQAKSELVKKYTALAKQNFIEIKRLLEKELSEDSFFDKSYILNRLERETTDTAPISSMFIENANVRFVTLSNFHDAKITEIINTEKYGKNCILMRIDFKGSTTEFKKGYRKFDIYFLNATYQETPTTSQELYIIGLDCKQQSKNLIINTELVYFTGTQEHRCTCKIMCNGIEVHPINKQK